MLSRKYYRLIARVIKDNTLINNSKMLPHNKVNKITLISDLCRELVKDNNSFNTLRFIDACAVDED